MAVANRVGEPVLHLRCVSLLALAALRRHDTVAVAALVPQALEDAEATSSPEYVAMAKASLAWLAWREGRSAEVGPRAEEALAVWANAAGWQPVHWILPLAAHSGPARDWPCRRSGRWQLPAFGALPTAPARRA